MTNTAATVDDVWGWLYQPLQDLKQSYSADPGKSWAAHRREFLEHLGLSQPTDHAVADALIHHLDELSEDDRNALLGGDGIDTVAYEVVQDSMPETSAEHDTYSEPGAAAETHPETSAQPDTYDEAAWHQFLATNLPSWNGTEEAWGQFSEWFTYHAGQAQLGSPAKVFLDHLAGQANDQRIATCAQYGVTIATSAAEPVAATGEMTALMEEILKERPEFAAIPEARRLELIAEVLAETDEDEEGED